MLKPDEICPKWESFKQIELGVKDWPFAYRFRLMGTTYFVAVNKDGTRMTRRSILSIREITKCSMAKMKELDK